MANDQMENLRPFDGEFVRLLPKIAIDADSVSDAEGNIYEFDEESKAWIIKGQIKDPDIVTEEAPGLVSENIYAKLDQIASLVDAGVDYGLNKVYVGDSTFQQTSPAYFNYLYSSDKLIKFKLEIDISGNKKLRIEVSKSTLSKRLRYFKCAGEKGLIGQTGNDGKDGTPAANETFQSPTSITSGDFTFETVVPTPIDTPISLRLFQDKTQQIEILIPLDPDDPITVIDSEEFSVSISGSEINYEPTSGTLSGTIDGDFEFDETWEYKTRQVGPKGEIGEDGEDFLNITSTMTDPDVLYKEAVISLRKSIFNLSFFKKQMFEDICVGNLRQGASGLPTGRLEDENLVSIQNTTFTCKNIGFFQFIPEDYAPPLNLPQWTPTKGCVDKRRYGIAHWDWTSQVPSLPFDILTDPEPPELCCQDPFFFCPNLGDSCNILGSPKLID